MAAALRRFSPVVALAVIWVSLMSLAGPRGQDTVEFVASVESSKPDPLLPDLASVSAAIAAGAEPVSTDALPPAVERVLSQSRALLLVLEGGSQ